MSTRYIEMEAVSAKRLQRPTQTRRKSQDEGMDVRTPPSFSSSEGIMSLSFRLQDFEAPISQLRCN